MSKIVTRFAPSPTGLLHSGNYRTAIFSYLYARKNGGKFILRIEDTDRERSKKEYEENIIESLNWLGLEYDELFRQSDRITEHTKALEKLIAEGKAYVAREEAKDGSGVIKEIVRFKNPGTVVSFNDLLRGTITIDTTDLKDFVIAKNIHEPLFHLAVVVDDAQMGITHIIRGEDHIANTPRQLLLYDALGYPRPEYVHLPLILSPDRTKLSKRKGARALTEYRDEGYLPEAVMNFLALLGWNPGDDREFFTKKELINEFTFEKIQKGAAIFNIEKLDWFNSEYIKQMSSDVFMDYIRPLQITLIKKYGHITPAFTLYVEHVLKTSITKLADVFTQVENEEFAYLFIPSTLDRSGLLSKDSLDGDKVRGHLQYLIPLLLKLEVWNDVSIKAAIMPYADREGRKEVLWPMRYALSGRDKSPDPFFLAYILGKDETNKRLETALAVLS